MDHRRISGFTLIEAVAALAVTTALLTLGVPAMAEFVHDQRTRSTAHLLHASLASARVHAITLGTSVSVCPAANGTCAGNGDWSEGWIVFRDTGRTGAPVSEDDVLHRVQPSARPGSLVVAGTAGRRLVRFLPDGRAAGTNASITVCSRHPRVAASQVVVSNVGRIRNHSLPTGPAACSSPVPADP